MRVLAFTSQKGGSGKPMLAGHLAVRAQRMGEGPVVLIGFDPSGALCDWSAGRTGDDPTFAQMPVPWLVAKHAGLRRRISRLTGNETPPVSLTAVRYRTDFAASMVDGRTVLTVDPKIVSPDEIAQLPRYTLDGLESNVRHADHGLKVYAVPVRRPRCAKRVRPEEGRVRRARGATLGRRAAHQNLVGAGVRGARMPFTPFIDRSGN